MSKRCSLLAESVKIGTRVFEGADSKFYGNRDLPFGDLSRGQLTSENHNFVV